VRGQFRSARTRYASGRFLCLLGGVAWTLTSACQTVGSGAREAEATNARPAPETDVPVVVSPGSISGDEQRAAAELFAAAQVSFEGRRFFEVIRTTEDLVERFPASDVSGAALELSARAHLENGDLPAADAAAGQYAGLLPAGDRRGPDARLLQARANPEDHAARLDRLLRIDEAATPSQMDEAVAMVRMATDSLEFAEIQSVVDSVALRGPLTPIAEARLSVSLLEMDRTESANLYAQRSIDDGVAGEELLWAQGVLAGELPAGRGRTTSFRIGVVLPMGGPPALADFSMLIIEGIEVAAATVLGEDYEVELIVRDDEGDPELTAQAVQELEAEGVQGIIGMLQDDDLLLAGDVRSYDVPLVSPTARSAARAGQSVFSLEGANTEAAASLAYYAVSRAFQRIAIVHPQTPEAEAEADAFERAAASMGMPVVGRFAYEAGATFFEPQIQAAQDALRQDEIAALGLVEDDTLHVEELQPTAIFLPVPPEDIEFLAPQVIHFGLDTLAIEILGTSGWTDPQTLEVVDTRHTTGVVATAAISAGAGSAGDLRFRQAYEEYFQRSLVGSTASIGYDALLLLLEALRPGRVSPEQVQASFGSLEAIPGATGIFSVIDGRVVRRTEVVRIENRMLTPLELRPAPEDSVGNGNEPDNDGREGQGGR
jgi:branched-chain amino acid transport system substrate-binding protein